MEEPVTDLPLNTEKTDDSFTIESSVKLIPVDLIKPKHLIGAQVGKEECLTQDNAKSYDNNVKTEHFYSVQFLPGGKRESSSGLECDVLCNSTVKQEGQCDVYIDRDDTGGHTYTIKKEITSECDNPNPMHSDTRVEAENRSAAEDVKIQNSSSCSYSDKPIDDGVKKVYSADISKSSKFKQFLPGGNRESSSGLECDVLCNSTVKQEGQCDIYIDRDDTGGHTYTIKKEITSECDNPNPMHSDTRVEAENRSAAEDVKIQNSSSCSYSDKPIDDGVKKVYSADISKSSKFKQFLPGGNRESSSGLECDVLCNSTVKQEGQCDIYIDRDDTGGHTYTIKKEITSECDNPNPMHSDTRVEAENRSAAEDVKIQNSSSCSYSDKPIDDGVKNVYSADISKSSKFKQFLPGGNRESSSGLECDVLCNSTVKQEGQCDIYIDRDDTGGHTYTIKKEITSECDNPNPMYSDTRVEAENRSAAEDVKIQNSSSCSYSDKPIDDGVKNVYSADISKSSKFKQFLPGGKRESSSGLECDVLCNSTVKQEGQCDIYIDRDDTGGHTYTIKKEITSECDNPNPMHSDTRVEAENRSAAEDVKIQNSSSCSYSDKPIDDGVKNVYSADISKSSKFKQELSFTMTGDQNQESCLDGPVYSDGSRSLHRDIEGDRGQMLPSVNQMGVPSKNERDEQRGENSLEASTCGDSIPLKSQLSTHTRACTSTSGKTAVNIPCGKKSFKPSKQQKDKTTCAGKTPFVCDVCGKTFISGSKMQRHIVTHTNEFAYKCSVCQRSFRLQGSLEDHMKAHTGDMPFICEECGKAFSRRSKLKRHIETHTKETPYKCAICEKSFRLHSYLNDHIKRHTEETPFECNDCGRKFSLFSYLKVHMRSHSEENPFDCSHCGKKCSTQSNLQSHVRTHTGEKPYECSVCGKTFTARSTLQGHILTHVKETPFKCTICEKSFSRNAYLSVHMKIHAAREFAQTNPVDKPHVCSTCGKAYSLKASLCAHIKTHAEEKTHVCSTCGKAYSLKASLCAHIKTHAEEKTHVCSTCGKAFYNRSALLAHNRTHTEEASFKCGTCGRAYYHKSDLLKHLQTHTGEKPFKCDQCGKNFAQSSSLNVHMRLHTGKQQFLCTTCGRLYNTRSHLERHLRTHAKKGSHECTTCGKSHHQLSDLDDHMKAHAMEKEVSLG